MRLKLHIPLLILLPLFLLTYGDTLPSANEEVDPCDNHECPEGETCTMVVNKHLLQLPVAHCVEDSQEHAEDSQEHDESPCQQYTVGANIMSCKSEDEWRRVGVTQCGLRGRMDVSELVEVEVVNVCHSLHPNSKTTFLSAKFTCCRHDDDTQEERLPPTIPPVTSQAPSIPPSVMYTSANTPSEQEAATYHPSVPDEGNHGDVSSYVIPVALGAVLITAIAVLILVCRRRRRHHTPKTPSLTFMINPSSEGWDDSSLLITTSQGK